MNNDSKKNETALTRKKNPAPNPTITKGHGYSHGREYTINPLPFNHNLDYKSRFDPHSLFLLEYWTTKWKLYFESYGCIDWLKGFRYTDIKEVYCKFIIYTPHISNKNYAMLRLRIRTINPRVDIERKSSLIEGILCFGCI